MHHTDDIRVLSLCASIRLTDQPLSALLDDTTLIAQSTSGAHCTFGIQVSGEAGRQLRHSDPAVVSVNERKQQKLEQDLQRLERTVEAEGYRRSASAKVKQQHAEKVHTHTLKYLLSLFVINVCILLCYRLIASDQNWRASDKWDSELIAEPTKWYSRCFMI